MAHEQANDQAPSVETNTAPIGTSTAEVDSVNLGPSPNQKPKLYVNTSLADAYENRLLNGMDPEDDSLNLNIPDHPPRSLVENPKAGGAIELPEKKKSPWVKRGIATAVAIGAVGAGAYGLGYLKTKGEVDAIKDAMGSDRSTSAPTAPGEASRDFSKIDPNTLTVEQFYDDAVYPQEYRIKWANEVIKQREQKAHDELSSILVQHGYPALKPLVAPNLNNTGTDIVVQHDVINYIASTDQNATEGMKLLAASSDYELAEKAFATVGKEQAVTFHTVPQNSETGSHIESPVFSHTVAGNYAPNGIPSKVLVYTNGVTSESSESIERFIGGRWVTHDVMGPNDPGVITNPQEVTDK